MSVIIFAEVTSPYGEKNPFQYFISHTDEKLVELVRKGRKQEFSYFKWEGEVPDPQSEETFKKCILSWPVDQDPDATNLLNFYRRLIALRKDHPAMRNTQRDSLEILASENGLLSFLRKAGEDQVLIVLNFNKQPADYTLSSGGPSKLLLDSSAGEWGGPARTNATGKGDSQVLTLQPLSVMIFHR